MQGEKELKACLRACGPSVLQTNLDRSSRGGGFGGEREDVQRDFAVFLSAIEKRTNEC